jgi:hypothetical protein
MRLLDWFVYEIEGNGGNGLLTRYGNLATGLVVLSPNSNELK